MKPNKSQKPQITKQPKIQTLVKLQKPIKTTHITQTKTPTRIRKVPNKAIKPFISSPKSIPTKAVAAKVVALVTGTAKEIGVSLKLAKKVAEADKFSKNGTEYCQVSKRLSQLLRVVVG